MKPKFIVASVALVVMQLASVCPAQEKLEKIYVGVAGMSGALAHAFIPKDSGLYEKYGLDVELIFFQGGTQGLQALLAGGLQFTISSGSETIGARFAMPSSRKV
jgi:ABC-type nitrate/sulfonate/bicarbonate transport system substrate-binding protein